MTNCPNVLANGTCSDTGCVDTHTILTCEPCALVFTTNDAYQFHLTDVKHHHRVSGSSVTFHCRICVTNITGGKRHWEIHVQGRRHRESASMKGISPKIVPEPASSTSKSLVCDLCQSMIGAHHWDSHMRGEKHQSRQVFTKYRNALEVAETDKHDVVVTGVFDFDFVSPSFAGMGVQHVASITTSAPFSKCLLKEVKLASAQGMRTTVTSFSVTIVGIARHVTPRTPIKLDISFKQPHMGRYEDRLELVFEDTQLNKQFIIARRLKVIVGNKAEHEALQPKTPYMPRIRSTREMILEQDVVEGVKPPALKAIRYVVPLPKANIPTHLHNILAGSETMAKLLATVRTVFMPQVLNSDTYGRHFKHLLWIEEFKSEQDLERYDIPNATLARHNNYYYLSVPGLAEKRPSVLVGDRILVQQQGSIDGRWYEGHVHVLRQAEVGLCFHGSFDRHPEGRQFHVRFKLNRIPLQRQHQGLDSAFTEDRMLFPLADHLALSPAPTASATSIRPYNNLISSNQPQLQAVTSILNLAPGSPPFVLFGPPGTGKTITVVEAIRQLLINNPHAKILACAPSNSAADLIASRLCTSNLSSRNTGLSNDQLFRFYAPSRFKNQVPDELLSYTCTQADGHFTVPLMARLKLFTVVVSTCVSASFCAAVGMPRGHFTHIFIDEAGQATEPEAFVSIKTMSDTRTNIVLSGDPKQLGPIIRSNVARELGLEKSYLERLMASNVYDLRAGQGRCVVKLTKNFRSHNAILHFPNNRFYDGELEQCAEPAGINKYLASSYLPAKQFPIVFHAVSGKDDREASSPSFFNVDEVLQVKSYVQRLKEDRRFRTSDADIGIIAPYHAQCKKLRTALRVVADGVKVGSVEEFQGQERPIIIISTVRSSKDFVEYDLRHTLGFVANPRRFNVAVTRAKALLIVIGDPQVLSLDPLWRSFLNYVYNNGGWTGPDITWDPQAPVDEAGGYDKAVRESAKLDMNEFARKMESLTMAEVDEDADAGVDRPWREVE